MAFTLSNKFKALLLDSYVNIKYDLAIKSMKELIDKPEVKIIYDDFFELIQNKTPEIIELNQRLIKNNSYNLIKIFKHGNMEKFRNGQAVIVCQPSKCLFYKLYNPHIQLVHSGREFHSFLTLGVNKFHSYSKRIYKL